MSLLGLWRPHPVLLQWKASSRWRLEWARQVAWQWSPFQLTEQSCSHRSCSAGTELCLSDCQFVQTPCHTLLLKLRHSKGVYKNCGFLGIGSGLKSNNNYKREWEIEPIVSLLSFWLLRMCVCFAHHYIFWPSKSDNNDSNNNQQESSYQVFRNYCEYFIYTVI